jgi:hypothetical protein
VQISSHAFVASTRGPLTLVATRRILARAEQDVVGGVSEMIAEVHQVKFPSGATAAPPEGANNLADEAAKAPGSAQLLTLMDISTGEGLVIHLWNDQAAYEAFAARRKELTADAERGSGSQIDPAHLFEVTYNG